jgi:hypothetical protein
VLLVRTRDRKLRKIKGSTLFKLASSRILSFAGRVKLEHSPPLCAEFMNGWSFISIPTLAFMPCLGTTLLLLSMTQSLETNQSTSNSEGVEQNDSLLKQRVTVLGVLDKTVVETSCKDIKLCATSLCSHKIQGFVWYRWQLLKLCVTEDVNGFSSDVCEACF